MAFKTTIMKLRRTLLCCSQRERKLSLDIGSPTDCRRVDISDALPGLTDAERKHIREKASSDAIHLLGLQSHPPSNPPTSHPSPTSSHSPSLAPTSVLPSREPSEALLNAASKDLPSALPTPPRRMHDENSPPAAMMKSMWDSPRRRSSSSSCHDGLYKKLEQVKGEEKALNESFMTLNLEFDFEENKDRSDSPRTLSLTEGVEMQNTTSSHSQVSSPVAKNLIIKQAIEATELGDSSDSEEEDSFAIGEQKPLVKI